MKSKRSVRPIFPKRNPSLTAYLGLGAAAVAIPFPALAADVTWDGAVNGTWNTTTANWSSSVFTSGDNALFTGTPANNVTAAAGLTIGTITLGSTFTGVVTLTGTNTVAGPTAVNGGTLSISANDQLGASAVSLNGGTLRTTNTTALTNTHAITVGAGGGFLDILGTATSGHNSRVITGANTLFGSGDLTINGDGALDGFGGASGALVLTGANNGVGGFTGTITLQNGGILAHEAVNGLAAGATVKLSNNSEFSVSAGTKANNSLIVNGGTSTGLSFTNGGTGIQAGAVTLNANLTVALRNWYNNTSQSGTISGAISGTGGLTTVRGSSGTPVLTLTGANTYSGATTIGANSVLTIGGSGSLGSGNHHAETIANNGSFNYASSANQTLSGDISGGGSVIKGVGGGILTLSGTSTFTGSLQVQQGSVNWSGTNTAATSGTTGAWLAVGADAGNKGILNITGGELRRYDVGVGQGTGVGAIYQSGGTFAVMRTAAMEDFRLGQGASGYGYYSLSGGTLTANEIGIGSAFGSGVTNTVGVMNVSGGTFTNTGWITIGRSGGTSSGLLNVTGGAVTAARAELNWGTAAGALSVLNVGGGAGTAAVSTTGSTTLGLNLANTSNVAGAAGVANLLTNGTLTTGIVTAGQANPTTLLNFNGGTLKATATNAGANFLTNANIDDVTVYGGGIIDNSGTNITIGKALQGATGNGVTSISVTNGGSGYVGAPLVKITGGTGNLATGYAKMVDDGTGNGTFKIDSIVITSGGTYSDTSGLSVSLTGGGSTKAATLGTISTSSNTSGGMAFKGSGTTTLTAANTYTGATNIHSGSTLALTGTGSIANSSDIVVNGTLDVSGLSASTFTIGSGQKLSGDGTVNATGKTLSIAGTHAVGNSPGQQDVTGNLEYQSNSIFSWDLNAVATDPGAAAVNQGSYDQVAVSGNLTGSGAIFHILLGTNSFADAFWDTSKSWNNIFTAGSGFDLASIFTSFGGLGVDPSGVVAGQGVFGFTGGNTLTWSAVPEPGGASAALLLAAGLWRRQRRKLPR